jgi:hypothetical protein
MDAYEAVFATAVEIQVSLHRPQRVGVDRLELSSSQKLEVQKLEKSAKILLRAHKEFTIPPLSLQEDTVLLKRQIAEQLERVKGQHSELKEILNDDEAMALMNLSYLRENPDLYSAQNIPETIDIHTFVEVSSDCTP